MADMTLAKMERELIVERTLAGLVAARAEGRIGGLTCSQYLVSQQQR